MTDYDSTEDTKKHIDEVQFAIVHFMNKISDRAAIHDQSKFSPEEKPYFDKYTPLLKTLEYGSDEYKASLEALKPALDHHYKVNSHHPEHFGLLGLNGMNLLDLVEMYCDWYAASKRTKNGNFEKSVHIGIQRFKIGDPLAMILKNSIRMFDEDEDEG